MTRTELTVRKEHAPENPRAKLDTVTRLLEDLFIPQGLGAAIARDSIRATLEVRTTRTTRINQGGRQARHNAEKKT